MHRALNRDAPYARWPHFDPGVWLDFNPSCVRLPDGRAVAVFRRDRVPPEPGRGSIWWVALDDALQPAGAPQPLLARGEDPRAVLLGRRLLVFYCMIDRDGDDRVCGATMMLAEFALEGGAFTLAAGFQLPKNPLALPGSVAWEKNWVPFAVSATEVALLYGHDPWQVLVLDCDPRSDVRRFSARHAGPALTWRHGHVRGGTPPLPSDERSLITFFHASQVVASRKVYSVGACVFDRAAPHAPKLVTRSPLLVAPYGSGAHRHGWRFAGSVVFPLGADRVDTGWRLLCGLDDGEVGVFFVPDAALAERLEAVDAGTALHDGDGRSLASPGPLLATPAAADEWPLARYGAWLAGPGRTAVDIRPGGGVAALAWCDAFKRVVACEPQAAGRAALVRNAALNGIDNLRIEDCTALDALDLRGVDLVRIDAPGTLLAVLQGAEATVARERPPLLLRAAHAASAWLAVRGYETRPLGVHHPSWSIALPAERRAAWAWWTGDE